MIPDNVVRIKSKKGQDIILMDLRSYAEDQIRVEKYKEDRKDYQIECPYCIDAHYHDKSYDGPYTKYKLYVYKDLQFGRCFRCDQLFIHNDDSLRFEIPFPEGVLEHSNFKLKKLSGDLWNLELFESFDEYDEKGYQYLIKKRHRYFKDLYKILGIKFTNHNPVIPFYYKGELIYFQIKLAFGNSKIPYFSPPIEYKPAYIIEHKENKKFFICEGTFDAISLLIQAPKYTPVALLG
jgi:hypothetical protein